MAINSSRSQNADLRLGATDGAFKNLSPDRGGVVETGPALKRSMVINEQYNITNRSPLAEVQEPTLSL